MFHGFHIHSVVGDLSVQPSSKVYYYGGLPEGGAYCYAQGVTELNSIISIKTMGDLLMTKPDCESAYVYLSGEHPLEYFGTDEYKQAIQTFSQSTYFLWGSWEKGGLFLSHIYNKLCWGISYGFYQKAENVDLYTYATGINTTFGLAGGQTNYLSEVAIMTIDNDAEMYEQPTIRVICNANLNPRGSASFYMLDTNSYASAQYDAQIDGYTLETAMNNPEWSTDWTITSPFTFDPVPVQPFMPWNNPLKVSDLLFNKIPSTYIHISGSWDAGLSYEPEDNGGEGEPSGTGGDYPTQDGNIPLSNPTGGIDLLSSGLIQLYKPTSTELANFQSYLFGNSIDQLIENQLKRLTANPYDYLIFLAMCNFNPTSSMNTDVITFCGQSSGVSAVVIPEQLIDIGPFLLNLPQASEDFTDYNPYTKVKIYLPYIGFQDLNVDEVIGGKLTLMYHIDLMTGSCVAELHITRSKRSYMSVDNAISDNLYNWQGNVYMMCPLSSNDFRGFFNSMTQFASGVGSMLSGNAIGGLGAMTTAVVSQKSTVQKNVPNGANYGLLSPQIPYLVIERPVRQAPSTETRASFEGIPSNMARKIGDISGYLETDENTVWGDKLSYTFETTTITAFDEEVEEIKSLFNSGVYV